MTDHEDRPTRRKASLLDTAKAVGASFFGVRSRRAHQEDVEKLNPIHVIVVGVVLAALFVLLLLGVVRWVVGA